MRRDLELTRALGDVGSLLRALRRMLVRAALWSVAVMSRTDCAEVIFVSALLFINVMDITGVIATVGA